MNPLYNVDLTEYVSQCKVRLLNILQRLEWSEETTLKNFNTNSLASALKKVAKKTHSPPKATYPESCISKNSLVLESSKLKDILQSNEVEAPCNFLELQRNFSREQKLKIYEHVIENTKKLENNTLEQEAEGETSFADILAQKKNEEKRKKRKFRKSKPTHIEEVRSLVDLQMQALKQFMGNKTKAEKLGCHSGSKRFDHEKKEHTSRNERKRYEDYYERDRYFEKSNKGLAKVDSKRKRHRSNSREYGHRRHKYHKRDLNKESSTVKRHKRRCSRERERHNVSPIDKIAHERPSGSYENASKEVRLHKSCANRSRNPRNKHSMEDENRRRSSDRHKRSYNNEIVKAKHRRRSSSYDKHTQIEKRDKVQKYSRRTDNVSEFDSYNKRRYESLQKDKESTQRSVSKQEKNRGTRKDILYCDIEYKSAKTRKYREEDK